MASLKVVINVSCLFSLTTAILQIEKWKSCLPSGTRLGTFRDASLQTCVNECGFRQNCNSLNYWIRGKYCELLDNNSLIEQDTTPKRPCVHVLRSNNANHEWKCAAGQVYNVTDDTCNIKGCSFPAVEHADVLGNIQTVTSRIKVDCHAGYRRETDILPITCNEFGTWSNIPICSATCVDPPVVANADVLPGNNSVGDVRRYSCHRHTILLPAGCASVTAECLNNNTWAAMNCQCVKVCPDPPAVGSADISLGNNVVGEVRQYSCHPDTVLLPDGGAVTTTKCLNDGTWTAVTFQCVKDCGQPGGMTNAVLGPGNTYETTERYYKCNEGFESALNTTYYIITCQSNGTWTSPSTSCIEHSGYDVALSYTFAFIHNYVDPNQHRIYVTSTHPTQVNISSPLQHFQQDYTVTGGTDILLPNTLLFPDNTGIHPTGIRLESHAVVHVYVENYRAGSADGSVVIPENHLSTEYVLLSWSQHKTYKAEFAVVSTIDATDVEIVLPDGKLLNVTLNAYQMFQYQTKGEISGTFISATKNIAVFGGHECTDVVTGRCDHLYEQMPPIRDLQREFIVSFPFPRSKYVIKIIAFADNTNVSLSNGISVTLSRGEYSQYKLDNIAIAITATNKTMVATYSMGRLSRPKGFPESFDGSMLIVPGLSQFTSQYDIFVPDNVIRCVLMITYPSYLSSLSNIRLNHMKLVANKTVEVNMPGRGTYTILYTYLTKGTGVIYTTDGTPFGAYLSFFRAMSESWLSLAYRF